MELLKTIYYFFYYLFRPSFWISNYRVDLDYDRYLNIWLDNEPTIKPTKYGINYEIVVEDSLIWVQNYPYAYGALRNLEVLPRRRTRERLFKYLLSNQLKNKE